MKLETFKCATGAGWGVLVDNMVDGELCYWPSEKQAESAARRHYPGVKVYTTKTPGHYAYVKVEKKFNRYMKE